MARKFIDGFESGKEDLWDVASISGVAASGALDGDYFLNCTVFSNYIQKNITADDEMYFAILYRPTGTTNSIITLYKDATLIFELRRSDGPALAYVSTSLVSTGSIPINPLTNSLIEVRFLMADSGGRIVVKVNGVTDIDYTGDTKPGADTQFNKVRLGKATWNGNAYFDNFIMDDADWIGDTKIQAVVPTGAGNTTGWTPSAGNNWECVDEKPASDADYVSINANDTTDTYATGNLTGTVGAVKCVQVQSRMRTDGAPTPTNLKLVVRSGAADYLSGDKAVPASEKSLWNLWETDPADAAAWTEADVNAMEIGVKSAA